MSTDDRPPRPPRRLWVDGAAATDRYAVVPIPVRVADCWLLTGRYVEVVWSELLGPTATLLARRLGDFVERHPAGGEVSVTAMGVSLGAAPSMVRASLVRLDRFGITSMQCGAGRGRGLGSGAVGGTEVDRAAE